MKYELHPACAVWPEMPPEALHELADDIAANGLHEPLTLTPEGLLLDGRNRALACELAGVEPKTVIYAGDPKRFSVSKNGHRRHMERDQIALVVGALVTTTQGRPSKEKVATATFSIADAVAASGLREDEIKSATTVVRDGTLKEFEAIQSGKAKLRATADAIRSRKRAPAVTRPSSPSKPAQSTTSHGEIEALKAQLKDLEAKLWSERDKLAQLAMFLVNKPPPKAENRPFVKHRYWGLPDVLERRPKDVAPRQILDPVADDPAFALRREEFEQWLTRRKEALEADLAKSFEADVKKRVEARFAKEDARGRVFTERQFMIIWRCLHTDGRKSTSDEDLTVAFRILESARKRLVIRAGATSEPPGARWGETADEQLSRSLPSLAGPARRLLGDRGRRAGPHPRTGQGRSH